MPWLPGETRPEPDLSAVGEGRVLPLGCPGGVYRDCAWGEAPGAGRPLLPLGEGGLRGADRFDWENWGAVPFGLVDCRLCGA